MQLAPDTVTHKFPYHGKALTLHKLLDRGGNVFEPVAEAGPSDGKLQRFLGDAQQLLQGRRNLPYRDGQRRIAVVAVEEDAHIQAQDVARFQTAPGRNAVDNLIVH